MRPYLLSALKRLDLLLAARVERLRLDPVAAGYNQYRGLFLSDAEIDAVLPGYGARPMPDCAAATALEQRAEELRREAAADGSAGSEPLRELARCFELDDFDLLMVLLCLAPEIDRKYEKLYAYLQNDVLRKWPTLDLALDLHCSSLASRLECRARLAPGRPLLQHQLITFAGDGADESASLLSRPVKLDPRIAAYLLGGEMLDEALSGFTHPVVPAAREEDWLAPDELKHRVLDLAAEEEGLCFFLGAWGCGRKLAAEVLAASCGRNLLVAGLPQALLNGPVTRRLAGRLVREAALRGAILYLDGAEALLVEEKQASRQSLLDALDDSPVPAILATTQEWDEALRDRPSHHPVIVFPAPDHEERDALWRHFLPALDPREASALAAKFQFTGGRIRAAIAQARCLEAEEASDSLDLDHIYRACRAQSATQLMPLARRVTPLFGWDDIILPAGCTAHLHEICLHLQHRRRVFGEWRFDHKASRGKGVSALFVGAPGTGKTMAAEVIAHELRLDLFKIDLSSVVSKYIGETEKNLSRIFDEADRSNGILFFDEADALFGKRSEVKDSHDRYANIEINYLLQRMEEYQGIVILASNFQKNIDEAFRRRLRFLVEFPLPDEKHRARIWQAVFPPGTPLDKDIDFPFLARKFKLAGGSIRNIALSAAFLAAEDEGAIRMDHLIRATRRELQKLGRLCVKSDFDHYFELVEPTEATA